MHIVIKEYGLIQRKYIVLHNALKQRHIGYLAMHIERVAANEE